MATVERQSGSTHEVFNQPPPLEDYNSFDADRPLAEALRREGAARGAIGGLQFGSFILVVDALSGLEREATLPEPAILLVVLTCLLYTSPSPRDRS